MTIHKGNTCLHLSIRYSCSFFAHCSPCLHSIPKIRRSCTSYASHKADFRGFFRQPSKHRAAATLFDDTRLVITHCVPLTGAPETWRASLQQEIADKAAAGFAVVVEDRSGRFSPWASPFLLRGCGGRAYHAPALFGLVFQPGKFRQSDLGPGRTTLRHSGGRRRRSHRHQAR